MSEQPVRVLSLDGGGVRGLSTLIILQALFLEICKLIGIEHDQLRPKDVFDVIVGTSTGGLIAIMMVKLNLSIEECIHQYKTLSREIFGKANLMGKLTLGFVKPRYSGEILRGIVVDLVKDHHGGTGEDYHMEDTFGDGDVRCSVVCREREDKWNGKRMPEPVFLCNHKCRPQPGNEYRRCLVPDAACCTSAAPTYFEARKILGKLLVDGGYGETNNPSIVALDHYRFENRKWSTLLNKPLIWLNIGTGSRPRNVSAVPTRRPMWTLFIPKFILEPYNLMNDMQQMATDSEQAAVGMVRLAKESKGDIQFARLSADNELFLIGLDDYKKIDDETIERLTRQYLERDDVREQIAATAKLLADAYKQRRFAIRQASVANSPIPASATPVSPSLPTLSRGSVTDEATEPPRTPQPAHAQPVPPESSPKSQSTDTLGTGQQFSHSRPPWRSRPANVDEIVRGDMYL